MPDRHGAENQLVTPPTMSANLRNRGTNVSLMTLWRRPCYSSHRQCIAFREVRSSVAAVGERSPNMPGHGADSAHTGSSKALISSNSNLNINRITERISTFLKPGDASPVFRWFPEKHGLLSDCLLWRSEMSRFS